MRIINEFLVDDINSSINFYKNILGFEVCETTGYPINWARLKNGNSELMIEDYNTAKKEFENFPIKVSNSNLIKFKYDNIDEIRRIYNKVMDSDINLFMKMKNTDYGTTEFAILDCDNNIIIISN